MSRPRLLFHMPELGFDGISTVFIQLANRLSNEFDVTIYAQVSVDEKAREIAAGSIPIITGVADRTQRKHRYLPQNVMRFRRVIQTVKPDVILSAYPYENLISALALRTVRKYERPRLIPSDHGDPRLYLGDNWIRKWLKSKLTRLALRGHTVHLAVSTHVADAVRRSFGRERIRVLPNPVFDPCAIDAMAAEPVDTTWFRSSEVPVIISVGRLTKSKDFVTLLRAFERVIQETPARLLLLGSGEEEGNLREEADRLGLTDCVWLPGAVLNPYRYVNRALVFAFPSLSEGQPLALLEALALSRPVVVTDFPGVTEFVTDGHNGLVVPRKDVERMAHAILHLIKSEEDRKNLSDAAQESAKSFTVEASVEAYRAVIWEVIGGKAVCPVKANV
jgi:glycosyltransferase involved in cell wall biosynthesis